MLRLLALALLASPPQEEDPAAAALVAWARETAVRIDLARPVPVEVLAPLVAGKRFVFLGESDHYVREKYPFRLAFLRTLHALGWRHLGMEMGRADGLRFDRYLESGRESDLGAVRLYAGAAAATGFVRAELDYARALRALGAGDERLRYFGFDLDLRPGAGLEDALGRLEGNQGAAELRLVLEDVWASGDRARDLALLVEELRAPESALSAGLPAETRRELVLDLSCLAASLVFQEAVNPLASPPPGAGFDAWLVATRDGFARREQEMFRQLDGRLAALGPDARLVLTGHDLHLSRRVEGTRWVERESETTNELWPTIGAYVTARAPEQVLSVWLLHDQGSHLDPGSGFGAREVPSVEGTLESLLARLPRGPGDEAWLLVLASDDPRSAWLDAERPFRVNGGVGTGRLRELTDVLVFLHEARAPAPR